MPFYERLSALDASFLAIEDDASHMNVGAILIFEAGPLRVAHGGLDMERIRAYVESRLHLVPRYRQRLAWIPVERHPVWVDDPHFNLFYHVRHTALPRPGEERQFKRLCGRILSQKLDLTKPLWENWIVEGLGDDRFAFIAKAHHAMVDGITGIDLLRLLLSPEPDAGFEPPPPWQPRPAPSGPELLAAEIARRGVGAVGFARQALRAATAPRDTLAALWDAAGGISEALGPGANPASPTTLNPALGPHRRFDYVRMDLAEVKRVKAALGGTVNDVVLAMVSGAARRFLLKRGDRLEDVGDFRAMVPVSLRPTDERSQMGNQVVNFIAHLPVDEPDPAARYRRVVQETTRQKSSRAVQAAELIVTLSDWVAPALLAGIIRTTAARRSYNMVVTNVPGMQIPLYMLGAPLRETYPMVPLFHTQGLGVALFSYNGGLFWGLCADWDALPDLHDFATALCDELATLQAMAGVRVSAA